jgi:pimeloyl-ACP methyl ester carboxylesterase
MITQRDVAVSDGRSVHVFDTGADSASGGLTLVWHHGSPQTGAPLEPVLAAAEARGIRLVSYARPSYGGSTAQPGRTVALAASDVAQVADALGIGRFASMGASGGGPHALACAAVLGDRVSGVVTLAGLAPLTNEFDWFEGMVAPGGLQAALLGRDARVAYAVIDEFDEESFIAADYAALDGRWSSLGEDVGRAATWGDDGLIDDDVAFVTPWGVDLAEIVSPALFAQGALDRVVPASHAGWLLGQIPESELWLRRDASHITILDAIPLALDWLVAHA